MANSPGDFTGIQKERLAKQHAEEQQKRAGEMAMVTAAQDQKKSREVVDYTKPKPAPAPDPGPVDYVEGNQDEEGGESDPVIDAIVASARESGDEPEPTAPASPNAAQPVAPVRVEKTATLIRARYDLPQVTIGHGNTYDFEEGRQYRVPPNVANHLAERELVDILQ